MKFLSVTIQMKPNEQHFFSHVVLLTVLASVQDGSNFFYGLNP